jgi:SAM-dependent methyltransferase
VGDRSVGFWDRVAPKYAAHKMADPAAWEHTLERTRAYLAPTDRVLELGAGTGTLALRLAPDVAALVATDAAPEMVRIARERAAETAPPTLRLEVADVDAALALDGDFDAVLAFNILHLLPDMEGALERIAARLPPGGHLISKTPCLADPAQGLLRFALPVLLPVLRLFGKAPEIRLIDEATLEKALAAAGFEIVEAGNFPARWRYLVARKR